MKLNVVLLGKHSNCTPMAYPVYRPLFERYVNFVTDPVRADIVILGHPDDFHGLAEALKTAINANPALKLFVVSEEPLWDSTWQGDFTKLHNQVLTEQGPFSFYYLNYLTTDVYQFTQLPYFITTNNDYFVRYQLLFNRNRQLTATEIVQHWHASAKACFMAQKRVEPIYDVAYPAADVKGLSRYRTLLAASLQGPDVLVAGQGWGETQRRQALPDWHLAKLTELDRRFFIMSALENTHSRQYITEKVFDAYALLSLPLYYASEQHRICDFAVEGSYVNLYGCVVEDAVKKIRTLSARSVDVAAYVTAQQQLAACFSSAEVLLRERLRLVRRLMALINAIG